MNSTHLRKLVNAFIPDATPSELVPSEALRFTNWFKRRYGGLWVGGTITVSSSGVSFAPNALNEAFHIDLQPVTMPAKDIRTVRREFGWFTGIVVVEHAHGEFRFRCYRAKQFAATMAATLHLSR